MDLYTYFRSSAAYRVRIALALKGITPRRHAVHLREQVQRSPDYTRINPNQTVPTLVLDDGTALVQSLAIIEYLDETYPAPPLLPPDALDRALVRQAVQVIACDTHPINNLRVVNHLRAAYGADAAGVTAWMQHWMAHGLGAFQALLPQGQGPFCFGDAPGLADIVLVPQLVNARRFELDLGPLARLVAIEQACLALPAFAETAPDNEPDAE